MVFHGLTTDDTEVAVEMLFLLHQFRAINNFKQRQSLHHSCTQKLNWIILFINIACGGFESQVKLPLRVHHRNLTNLVGYCNEEGTNMALVYKYMFNGDVHSSFRFYAHKIVSVFGFYSTVLFPIAIKLGKQSRHLTFSIV